MKKIKNFFTVLAGIILTPVILLIIAIMLVGLSGNEFPVLESLPAWAGQPDAVSENSAVAETIIEAEPTETTSVIQPNIVTVETDSFQTDSYNIDTPTTVSDPKPVTTSTNEPTISHAEYIAKLQAAQTNTNQTLPTTWSDIYYVGNATNGKLHLSTCYLLPSKKNWVTFKSREEATVQGYDDPCKICLKY